MNIKPCPFCGDDKPMPSHSENGEWNYVTCWGCDATTGPHETAEKAIDAWNRRAPTAELVEAWEKVNCPHNTIKEMAQAHDAMYAAVKKLCEEGEGGG